MADCMVLTKRSQALWEEKREARRKFLWTSLLSLLFHIILIVLIAWLFEGHLGGKHRMLIAPKKEQVVTLDFVPVPPRNATLPQYIDTDIHQATAERPPVETPFESDKNTQASSELPAAGEMPLPTISGTESPEGVLQFEDKEYSPGRHAGSGIPKIPAYTHPPVQPSIATPAPKKDTLSLKPNVAEVVPPDRMQESPHRTQISPPLPPGEQPGYHAVTRAVRVDGNVAYRGRAATNAVATPLGRYRHLLSHAIGARWYSLIQRDMDLYRIGTVVIRFHIQQNGKIDTVQIVSNTSNELLAATSIQSIKEVELPPIPPDVAASLYKGRIEVDYTFSIIAN